MHAEIEPLTPVMCVSNASGHSSRHLVISTTFYYLFILSLAKRLAVRFTLFIRLQIFRSAYRCLIWQILRTKNGIHVMFSSLRVRVVYMLIKIPIILVIIRRLQPS